MKVLWPATYRTAGSNVAVEPVSSVQDSAAPLAYSWTSCKTVVGKWEELEDCFVDGRLVGGNEPDEAMESTRQSTLRLILRLQTGSA